MTDQREPEPEFEHDEFHSSLEVDDSSGWRVFVVPVVLIVIVIGMIAAFFIYDDNMGPDPRIADRLKKEQQQEQQTAPAPAPVLPVADPGAVEQPLEEQPAQAPPPTG